MNNGLVTSQLTKLCALFRDRHHHAGCEMNDAALSMKNGNNYSSLYSNSPQHHSLAPLSPFSAAVAAATQNPAMSGSNMAASGNSNNGTNSNNSQSISSPSHSLPYSFHPPSKMGLVPAYQENYGVPGNLNHCVSGMTAPVPAALFPSMSVNVSMNMTMDMSMSSMGYGLENPPLQWNTSAPIHVPVAVQQNQNNTNSAYAAPPQGLLSPIQVNILYKQLDQTLIT